MLNLVEQLHAAAAWQDDRSGLSACLSDVFCVNAGLSQRTASQHFGRPLVQTGFFSCLLLGLISFSQWHLVCVDNHSCSWEGYVWHQRGEKKGHFQQQQQQQSQAWWPWRFLSWNRHSLSTKAAMGRSQTHTSSQQRLGVGALCINTQVPFTYTETHTLNPYLLCWQAEKFVLS